MMLLLIFILFIKLENTVSSFLLLFNRLQSKNSKSMLRRATTLIGVSVIGGYCADTTINDDWDSWKDMFRTKISAEERMKHPRKKLVILGTRRNLFHFFSGELTYTHTHARASGTGWGALNLVRKLHCDKYDVTIVSPRNYFLFTPLLAGSTVTFISEMSHRYIRRGSYINVLKKHRSVR